MFGFEDILDAVDLIWCWILDYWIRFKNLGVEVFDSMLDIVDTLLASISTAGLTVPVIPSEYVWLIAQTGIAEALALVAAGVLVRFTLQLIPFVRLGS